MTPLPPAFQFFIVLCTGLILGSFATALSWRSARGLSWAGGRSECPTCHAKLSFLDLIPLFSWLALRGRCRHCKAAIGIRYPLIELAVVLGCLGLYAVWQFSLPAFVLMAALPFLAGMFVVDMEQMILPDSLQAIVAGLGVLFVLSLPQVDFRAALSLLTFRVAAGIVAAGVAWGAARAVSWRRKKQALGMGDVKFFATAGLYLGINGLPWFMIFGGGAGLVYGVIRIIRGRRGVFPFGPCLIMALYAGLLLEGLGLWR